MVAAVLAACSGAPTRAVHEPDSPFERCRTPAPRDEVPVIDETRRGLHETVCAAALWFDGLFGPGDLRAARQSHGRVEASIAHSELEGVRERLRFHVRVKFPALEQRLSAFVGRDSDEDFVRDRTEGLGLRSQFPRVDDEEEWLAGLGYGLPERYRLKMELKVGARSLSRPRAFAQYRIGWTPYSDDVHVVHARATPFANTLDGFGLTTSLDLSRMLGATRLVRWGTVGTVSENTAGLDWRSAVILYQDLPPPLGAIAPELFERGATAAAEPLGEFGARVVFRQPLFMNRLYAELIPGYSWPRSDPSQPRDGSFAISLGFEMPFGAP